MSRRPLVLPALCALLVALTVGPRPASAETPTPVADAARTYLDAQYDGETVEIIFGAVQLVLGVIGGFSDDRFRQRAAFPIVVGGAVLATRGLIGHRAVEPRVAALQEAERRDPAAALANERARVERARDWAGLGRLLDLYVIAAGAGTVVLAEHMDNPRLSGLGAGAMIVGATLLVFDGFADARAERYGRALSGGGLSVGPIGGGLGVGWAQAF